MQFNRRHFLLSLSALGLAACARGGTAVPAAPQGLAPEFLPQPNPGFSAWVEGFKARASSSGIAPNVVESAMNSAGFLPGVIERDRNQTEFRRTLEDYLAITASDEKVRIGRAKFAQFSGVLGEVEARYGVPARIVCAIWGVESNYGARRGNIPVISALSTLAFDGRRGAFFEAQLIAALRILQNGDVSARNMTGSWAGAMGHTQFIPTSYQQFAVDFRGDGRRDIWSEDPTDGLASTAAYLSRNGWRSGTTWGAEVGTSSVQGRTLTPEAGGPSFTVTANFNVIKRYNNSDLYAIGVGHLSDRIAGGGPIRAAFPPDRFGLTIDQRRRLQSRLTAQGFDTGGTDGVIGRNTEAAVRAWQAANGLAVTGQPSPEMLAALG